MVTAVLSPTPVITVTLPELYDPESGLLDAQRMADYLAVPLSQLAATLGRRYQTVHKTPTSPALQDGLFTIKRSLDILAQVLGERAMVLAWLKSPHPDLDMRAPIEVILDGHAEAVEGMLVNAMAGIPS